VLYPLSYEGGRAELTGRDARRPPGDGGSPQFGDDLGEGVEVVVLHGEAAQPVLLAEPDQGVGHVAW
jgi:hypothetical protein